MLRNIPRVSLSFIIVLAVFIVNTMQVVCYYLPKANNEYGQHYQRTDRSDQRRADRKYLNHVYKRARSGSDAKEERNDQNQDRFPFRDRIWIDRKKKSPDAEERRGRKEKVASTV